MIKIAFICSILTLVNSNEYEFDNNALDKLGKSIFEARNIIGDQLVNEDAAILLSNPKAGKSTLINYLIGNKLKAAKDPLSKNEIIMIKADNESKGPEIGTGSLSNTYIPTKWKSTILPNLSLWDTPAFFDNRGVVQDVTNAYYLHKVLQSVKSLKIILVVDIQDLNRNHVKLFLSLLDAIDSLFGKNFESHFSSVSVIFSKVPNAINRIPVDYNYINNKLETIFLNPNLKMAENSRKFIRYIISNNDRIALFKKISKVGKVSLATNGKIFTTIKNSQSIDEIPLKDAHLHISDSSMIMLFKAVEGLLPFSKMDEVENIASQALLKDTNNIRNLITDKNADSINNIKEELTKKKELFSKTLMGEKDLFKKLTILLSFHYDLQELNKKDKLISKLQLISNVEKLLQATLSSDLNFSLDIIIISLYLKLKTAISLCNTGLLTVAPDGFVEDNRISFPNAPLALSLHMSPPPVNTSGFEIRKPMLSKYLENAYRILNNKLSTL